MREKLCAYCSRKFVPCKYRPNQQVCSSPDCQRRRRAAYHRRKLNQDPLYREQCLDSQRKWRERNPAYMKRYRARRRIGSKRHSAKRPRPLTTTLRDLLRMVKNNVALDLRVLDAKVWLVVPKEDSFVKNTLATAKLIILQGIPTVRP